VLGSQRVGSAASSISHRELLFAGEYMNSPADVHDRGG
jgi:hypothetical protein